jgi:CHAT domain-containing protein
MQINQMTVLRSLGRYQEAIPLAQEARALCLHLGESAQKYLAILETNIGWVYQEIGDLEAALTAYDNAREIFSKLGLASIAATNDANKAYLLLSMDRFQEAERLYHQAKTVFEGMDALQAAARIDMVLGKLNYRRGHYYQALHYLSRAYNDFNDIPLPVEVACVQLNQITVYHKLNLLEDMMLLIDEAELVLRHNKMQREHNLCLMYKAFGLQQLGRYKQAQKYMALARRQTYRQGAWGKLWQIDWLRAELLFAMEEVDSARLIARRTLNRVDSVQNPALAAHLQLLLARCTQAKPMPKIAMVERLIGQALKLAQSFHLLEVQIQAHYLWGQLQLLQERHEAAWHSWAQAVQGSEQLRLFIASDELQVGYMVEKLPVYADYVSLTHQRVVAGDSSYAHLLYSLNLALNAPLPQVAPEIDIELSAEEKAQLADLRQTWHWYQNKLEAGQLQLDGPEQAGAAWGQKLYALEREIAEMMRRQRLRSNHHSHQENKPKPVDLAEPDQFLAAMQAKLGQDAVYLHFYFVGDKLQAFLITKEGSQLFTDLSSRKSLHKLLQAWRFHLQHQGRRQQSEVTLMYLSRFYQALWQPLHDALAEYLQVYLLLPPDLHDLPVAAFYDGQQYVVEQHQLVYLSTPEALLKAEKQATRSSSSQQQAVIVGYSDNGRLSYIQEEVEQINTTLSLTWDITQIMEEEATLAAVRRVSQTSQLLHLATHAVFRPDNPLFSWMRLADTRLTVTDLYDMHLPQRPLVVLSACETGQGQPRGGGLMGMGRGFLAAGASGLVLTLWRIEDQSSARFMADFYQGLQPNKANIAWALQQAQQKAIRANRQPYDWAAFVFMQA